MSQKYLDVQELMDNGYLHEANRRFFHPLGLALELSKEEDEDTSWKLRIQDHRDDPEGVLFHESCLDKDKVANIDKEWSERAELRPLDECTNGVQQILSTE